MLIIYLYWKSIANIAITPSKYNLIENQRTETILQTDLCRAPEGSSLGLDQIHFALFHPASAPTQLLSPEAQHIYSNDQKGIKH